MTASGAILTSADACARGEESCPRARRSCLDHHRINQAVTTRRSLFIKHGCVIDRRIDPCSSTAGDTRVAKLSIAAVRAGRWRITADDYIPTRWTGLRVEALSSTKDEITCLARRTGDISTWVTCALTIDTAFVSWTIDTFAWIGLALTIDTCITVWAAEAATWVFCACPINA